MTLAIPREIRISGSIYDYLVESNKISIIFHWDSDGIASASILKELLLRHNILLDFIVPKIGYYSADAIDIPRIKAFKPDLIVVLDYALKAGDLEILEQVTGTPVLLIDHHINTLPAKPLYYNPVASGYPQVMYPSTTWVIKELLRLPLELKILLGIAGDRGVKAKETPIWGHVKEYLNKMRWRWRDLVELAELVDSTYRVGNIEGIVKSTDKLLDYNNDLGRALRDREWANARKLVENEIEAHVNIQPSETINGKILVFKIKSAYYIASAITRRLALKYQDKIIVVSFRHMKDGPCHIYARSWKYDLMKVIISLALRGYNIGGKNEVAAITIECYKLEQALEDMINAIKETNYKLLV